ncbi:MAG: MFS transporter [Bacteroidaceae bacterium]|nr:MFS transporter [Prevotellaceae bacterium]MDY2849945.1 MFS transporter [Bacteroidaceae bacterium]
MDRLWNSNYIKVWVANFMIFFSFMIVMPLLPLYLSEIFMANKHVIGLVLSGYTITALLIRPLSGYLVDSFSRKKILLISYFLFFIFFAGYIVATSLLLFTIIRTIHGVPMGTVTVANSTVAIDVLPSTRRAEGIGYYGLSNNLATAIAPTVGLLMYQYFHSYDIVFIIALLTSGIGLYINSTVKLKERIIQTKKCHLSLDRFILLKGWSIGITLACLAFSYGIISTYLAIYGKEELHMTSGTGIFFAILCFGLMTSRIIGARTLRRNMIVLNCSLGIIISLFGYFIFAAFHNYWGYYGSALIIGLGNGHMFPAMQNMFISLAASSQRGTANSTLLTSWDIGIGLGVLFGGSFVEWFGYTSAFWLAWVVNALGVSFFFAYARLHYQRNKYIPCS